MNISAVTSILKQNIVISTCYSLSGCIDNLVYQLVTLIFLTQSFESILVYLFSLLLLFYMYFLNYMCEFPVWQILADARYII